MEPTIILNQYVKVLLATQRAKQLKRGAQPRVQITSKKVTTIALEEVALGLIGYELPVNAKELPALP